MKNRSITRCPSFTLPERDTGSRALPINTAFSPGTTAKTLENHPKETRKTS
ncbi:MAG: hypothetical protein LBH58_13370 [Tannerellaceae bacterium]|nr:hypothetical protein [Tannerellaceae bacterium]